MHRKSLLLRTRRLYFSQYWNIGKQPHIDQQMEPLIVQCAISECHAIFCFPFLVVVKSLVFYCNSVSCVVVVSVDLVL